MFKYVFCTYKTLIRFGLLGFLLLIVSCQQSTTNKQDDYFLFVDDYDRVVNVPNNPKRIVSVSPAITEIIFAIDASDKLVGRTDFCNFPPEVESIESIGGINNLNVEKLLSLCPDLVLIGSMVPENTVNLISKAGIPLVAIREKEHFDALFDNIERIGTLCNKKEEAKQLNANLQQKTNEIKNTTIHQDNKATVYYVVGYGKGGNFTAGGNTFINDIFTICGLSNVAKDIVGWNYSTEALLNADPDYIFIRKEDIKQFCQTEPYTYLKAVKNGNVIPIESAYIDLQVPRNIEGLLYIYNTTHNADR